VKTLENVETVRLYVTDSLNISKARDASASQNL